MESHASPLSFHEEAEDGAGSVSGTCSEYVARACVQQSTTSRNSQLCVVSPGFDIEVVVPDGLPQGTVTSLGALLSLRLRRDDLPALVRQTRFHVIDEGMTTTSRCSVYHGSGVVVVPSHMLCADLLHRRLSLELVAVAVLMIQLRSTGGHTGLGRLKAGEMITPNVLFCAEMLLRGSTMHTAVTAARGCSDNPAVDSAGHAPRLVVLSDHPVLIQYLAQRHRCGLERLTVQLHIGDVQLFPRFRLAFVRHFEKLSQERPLTVGRIVVRVNPAVGILDDLLGKIVRETLSELQSTETRLHISSANTSQQEQRHRLRNSAADIFDADEATRFQPRVRPRYESGPGGAVIHYGGAYPTSRRAVPQVQADSPAAAPLSYVHKSWRHAGRFNSLNFRGITAEACLHVAFSDLDADLRMALNANEPSWPYRAIVESLIDLRMLRRVLRHGSGFDFLLALESALEKRSPVLPRCVGGGYTAAAAPPAAVWTLSSFFNDLITVASHRIGTLAVEAPTAAVLGHHHDVGADVCNSHSASSSTSVVDCDVDDEVGEVEVVGGISSGTASLASPRVVLTPNKEDVDYVLEVVCRLALSWGRGAASKAERTFTAAATSRSTGEGGGDGTSARQRRPPALLVVAYNQRDVITYVERLLNTLEDFQKLQLRSFAARYQARCGLHLPHVASSSHNSPQKSTVDYGVVAGGPAETPHNPQSLFEQWVNAKGGGVDEANDDDEGDDNDGRGDGDRGTDEIDVATQERTRGSKQRQQAGSLFSQTAGAIPECSLHHALLSQVPDTMAAAAVHERGVDVDGGGGAADTGADGATGSDSRAAIGFKLEKVSAGIAMLVCTGKRNSHGDAPVSSTWDQPRIVVVDGSCLSVVGLVEMIQGVHTALAICGDVLTETDEGREVELRCAVVRRIVLTQQRLGTLRTLEMAQDQLDADTVSRVKAQLVVSSMSDTDFGREVEDEREAFESLAHVKASLVGQLLADRMSLQQTEELLSHGGTLAHNSRRRSAHAAQINGTFVFGTGGVVDRGPPRIVFDEREFRSSLPYTLYCRGIDVVPLTLTTADYVLSSEYAVERKGLRDYVQSLVTGRIFHQLSALSRRYARPICLIEFSRTAPFRLTNYTDNSPRGLRMRSGGGGGLIPYSGAGALYARTARLVAAYPNVRFMWSRGAPHTAMMMLTLKRTVAVDNVDPSDPSLTSSAIAYAEESTSGDAELAHHAARVCSRFPGVTPDNAPRVMERCGSLAGLAMVSEESLASVMGAENAHLLYTYLHSPFSVDVG